VIIFILAIGSNIFCTGNLPVKKSNNLQICEIHGYKKWWDNKFFSRSSFLLVLHLGSGMEKIMIQDP
jgi:hypothetical protein